MRWQNLPLEIVEQKFYNVNYRNFVRILRMKGSLFMKKNTAIRQEIIEYIESIENHKALVAILKFIKIIYRRNLDGHGGA